MNAEVFIQQFERHFPLHLAEEGDPVGLQIGTLDKEIERVMITLDVRPEVVVEAIENNIDLLIAKHPPIFRPVRDLVIDSPQTKMYADLLKHDIAVYAAHTNMDIVPDGLNDWFCELLGIKRTSYIKETHFIDGHRYGIGRIGELDEPMSLQEMIQHVKETFQLDGLRVISPVEDKPVSCVAICGGSGEKFYPEALKKGADVYITGDVYYHTGHDMIADGLTVIDAGHYIEAYSKKHIANMCQNWKKEYNWDVEICYSEENTNPFKFY
ncbi:Nif3-like dinuclear metal center hexameric protein [Vagococcus lutrae]|uniref:Nif3-like dinuclear metal center hexameric protein n=1 Tax=Vagococcus lutrae TaxID=81947 RepID=UPI0023A927E2|nr:Nif3-like dinuclear metal center hexameric protein [Vagococcus lutrae]WEB82186.1 Nif3-like dinuclear metal center hexameric protein [Vagococcus lutrae]